MLAVAVTHLLLGSWHVAEPQSLYHGGETTEGSPLWTKGGPTSFSCF